MVYTNLRLAVREVILSFTKPSEKLVIPLGDMLVQSSNNLDVLLQAIS